MPWNWTVQNNTLPSDQQTCKSPAGYLSLYAAEHIFWLFATFALGWTRLKIAQHEEAKNRSVLRYLILSFWTRLKYIQQKEKVQEVLKEKYLPDGEHLRPALTDRLRWGYPVIMGALLAGLQLGFNFLVAHLIKGSPGYEDVPLPFSGEDLFGAHCELRTFSNLGKMFANGVSVWRSMQESRQ